MQLYLMMNAGCHVATVTKHLSSNVNFDFCMASVAGEYAKRSHGRWLYKFISSMPIFYASMISWSQNTITATRISLRPGTKSGLNINALSS